MSNQAATKLCCQSSMGGYTGHNRDRIIITIQKQNMDYEGQLVDQIYIAQHRPDNQGLEYDSHYTYLITTTPLRELSLFCVRENIFQLTCP